MQEQSTKASADKKEDPSTEEHKIDYAARGQRRRDLNDFLFGMISKKFVCLKDLELEALEHQQAFEAMIHQDQHALI